MTILSTIPFAGFYYSIHSQEFENEFEQVFTHFADETGRDIPESLSDKLQFDLDYSVAYDSYAKGYAESFLDWIDVSGTFESMSSPRFYNFETDRVFVEIDRATLAKLWKRVDKSEFAELCKRRFTSRDGFISHYSPDWKDWGRLSEWDHNQIGTLVECVATAQYCDETCSDSWDQWAEFYIMESALCNGLVSNLTYDDGNACAWKLFDYLVERAQRPVKTMAQWRVKYAKPFETTPLGSVA